MIRTVLASPAKHMAACSFTEHTALTCEVRVAPVSTVLTRGFLAHQARASCARVQPSSSAMGFSLSTCARIVIGWLHVSTYKQRLSFTPRLLAWGLPATDCNCKDSTPLLMCLAGDTLRPLPLPHTLSSWSRFSTSFFWARP